jgi:integrase
MRHELLVVDSLNPVLVRPAAVVPVPAAPLPSLQDIKERLIEWEAKFCAARSAATLKAVRADWQVFVGWCETSRVWALPASSPDLLRFLTDQVVLGKKRSTIDRYVNTIRLIHKGALLPDPTHYADWKLDWQALVLRLAENDASAPEQAEPMRTEHVRQILATLGETPLDLRDAALISLASDTLCRESELAALKVQDIVRAGNAWAIDLRRNKTDQAGLGTSRYCSPATKARIDAWCASVGIKRGYLFIPVGKGRQFSAPPPKKRKSLGAVQVARIMRRRAKCAGVPDWANISGHSGRVGSAIEMLEAGASVTEVQFAGGWKSPRMVLHYGKRALAGRNAMAKLREAQAASSKDTPAE